MNVINLTSPSADLNNIFESFLPQLLTYPNPSDPLNGDAAALYLHKPEEYKKKISDYIKRYATDEALREADMVQTNGIHDSSGEESELSDLSDDENGVNDMEL